MDKRVCTTINKEIKDIERQIDDLISQCDGMQEMFNLITSVPGVGKVLTWELLIKTDLFRAINDPRKLACFAGVVPFEHSSGTSVHRRLRVSLNADKALKELLHMAALRVTHLKGELQLYYIRKVAEVTDNAQWQGLSTGAWAYHNNDAQLQCPYGRLYNWFAVADQRNLCASG